MTWLSYCVIILQLLKLAHMYQSTYERHSSLLVIFSTLLVNIFRLTLFLCFNKTTRFQFRRQTCVMRIRTFRRFDQLVMPEIVHVEKRSCSKKKFYLVKLKSPHLMSSTTNFDIIWRVVVFRFVQAYSKLCFVEIMSSYLVRQNHCTLPLLDR